MFLTANFASFSNFFCLSKCSPTLAFCKRLEVFRQRLFKGGISDERRKALIRSLISDKDQLCLIASLSNFFLAFSSFTRVIAKWILKSGSHPPN